MRVGIVDYRCGNTQNLARAISVSGGTPVISGEKDILYRCDMLCLPGMGAFAAAMEALEENHLIEFVQNEYGKKFILAICVGMQILHESSDEGGFHAGLGLFKGAVRKIPTSYKLPHIGWKQLQVVDNEIAHGVFSSLPSCQFYFSHSFATEASTVTAQERLIATDEYGGFRFAAATLGSRCLAVQFHPERSRQQGLDLIRWAIRSAGKGGVV